MTDPVLVGLDGSAASRRAVRWAAQAAGLRHRPLRMMTVFRWPVESYTVAPRAEMPDEAGVRDQVREMLDGEVRAVRAAHPDLDVRGDFVDGTPAKVLVEQSAGATLTVLGQRGEGGLTGLLLGSVATQVATHASGPVVVVPDEEPGIGPVVVGVDGSELSEPAIGFAFEEASWRRVELVAVHAWAAPGSHIEHDRIPRFYNLDEVIAEERRVLAESLAGWRVKYPDVSVRPVLAHGAPVPELLSESAGARLLVVGSRGRGGFAGLLLGSTSRSLLHRATCPVAVVRR